MKNTIEVTFNNMPEAISRVSEELTKISITLAALQLEFEPKIPNEYLTRQEVAEMLKCDLSTVHNWTTRGILTKYCISNRTYYKRSDIEAALVKI